VDVDVDVDGFDHDDDDDHDHEAPARAPRVAGTLCTVLHARSLTQPGGRHAARTRGPATT
jgi:hypothetical protein